jgi:cytochrome c oxidase assembly protein subunit 11
MDKRRGNLLIAGIFSIVAIGMVGMSFAAIPLYRMFCQATGYGGTPKIGEAPAPGGNGRTIRVRFNADVNPELPWTFAPDQLEIAVPLGEDHLASYTARNKARSAITGVALYNVTPEKAAKYFHKTACFCFNKQTLEGEQTMDFPLSFWVDPEIGKDPGTSDVQVVTLSYTFFRTLDDAEKTGALAKAGPHVGPLTTPN